MVSAGAAWLHAIAVTERPGAVNELQLVTSKARAGARLWSLAEWARGRSTTSGTASRIEALRPGDGDHELSMRVGTAGRYRGPQPRSKVSMMIMRPPQQGQGCASVCCSPSLVLSPSLGPFCGVGRLRS